MAVPKKLICDRCGNEITDRDSIELILEGAEAWQLSVIDRDAMPRGLFPCKNYMQCEGEMQPPEKKGLFRRGGNNH